MLVRFLALAFALALTTTLAPAAPPAGMMPLPPQPKVRPAGIPAGYLMVSPCIPMMGEHWANPKDMRKPIYGTYRGKPIFSEIMVPKSVLMKGFNYANLRPLPGYTIDHVDLTYEPNGHPGMTFPHYDIHAYYISRAMQMSLCPNAMPG